MALYQSSSHRKCTGGLAKRNHGKKRFEIGSDTKFATLEERKIKKERIRSGSIKDRVVATNKINVVIKGEKTHLVEISGVAENPANPHYARRNLITKGAILDTPIGRVRVTSRPSQNGGLSGVLIAKNSITIEDDRKKQDNNIP